MDLVNAARLEADGYQLAAKTPDNRKLGYAIECAAKIVMAMNTMDFNKVTSVSTPSNICKTCGPCSMVV